MKTATKDYIINTVFRTNILPVISRCNTSCVFCSHKQNPQNIEVFRMPELSLDDFKEIIHFLSPDRKIVIGESATRIIEGEPLLYDKILELLEYIRLKYQYTPIQITTNGILLSRELIDRLEALGNIELNISVNGVNPSQRAQILGIKNFDNIAEKLEMLKGRINFSGSFVLVPDILTAGDIEEIISILNDTGAKSIRIFLPGYTKLSRSDVKYEEIYAWADQLIGGLKKKYAVPVMIEPAIIKNLDCRVEGIVDSSPAMAAGVKTNDIIRQVNHTEVNSRVDGFNKAFTLPNPVLTIEREGRQLELKLEKTRNSSPGFAVLYDIDPDVVALIYKTVARHKAKNVLFMTSELAVDILKTLLGRDSHAFVYRVMCVKNEYFGGTIKAAGLLTSEDVIRAWEGNREKSGSPDLIILPPIMFDFKRNDLLGVNIKEIEARLGIPVDIV